LNRVLFYLIFALLQLPLFGQNQPTTGYCSFYADKFQGRHTSSGDLYDKNAYTAAHRSLPFNTIIEITNIRNQKKVLVRVNDRGPQTKNRVLDISKAAALQLDMISYGVEKVSYRVLDSATAAGLMDTLINKRYKNIGTEPLIKKPVKTIVETTAKTTEKSIVKTTEKKTEISSAKIPEAELKNRQIFDENLKPEKPNGYGVQVGYYKIRSNCTAAIVTYEKTYKTQGYFWVEQFTKNTYYHLIMGNFTTRAEAEKLRQVIIKTIPGCFVMDWNKI
jgi:rare lipoprotein A